MPRFQLLGMRHLERLASHPTCVTSISSSWRCQIQHSCWPCVIISACFPPDSAEPFATTEVDRGTTLRYTVCSMRSHRRCSTGLNSVSTSGRSVCWIRGRLLSQRDGGFGGCRLRPVVLLRATAEDLLAYPDLVTRLTLRRGFRLCLRGCLDRLNGSTRTAPPICLLGVVEAIGAQLHQGAACRCGVVRAHFV